MTAKLPIQIDGKQYNIVANEISEEDLCEKCAFYFTENCPDHICTFVFPRCDTYIERI